jgi:hypothetical protein
VGECPCFQWLLRRWQLVVLQPLLLTLASPHQTVSPRVPLLAVGLAHALPCVSVGCGNISHQCRRRVRVAARPVLAFAHPVTSRDVSVLW